MKLYKMTFAESGKDFYYLDRYNMINDILTLNYDYYRNDTKMDKNELEWLLSNNNKFKITTDSSDIPCDESEIIISREFITG